MPFTDYSTIWQGWTGSSTQYTIQPPNQYIWTTWTSNTSATQYVWGQWTGTGTMATSGNLDTTWTYWQGNQTPVQQFQGWTGWVLKYDETQEQREQREQWEAEERARQEERLARYREMEEQRAKAEVRAKKLLRHMLGETDYEALMSDSGLVVVGASGHRFRVRSTGASGNVELLTDEGTTAARLCAHPGDALPLSDHLLAQVLHIQADDEEFVSVANVHAGRLPDELAARRVQRLADRAGWATQRMEQIA